MRCQTQRIGDVLASVRKHARDGTLSRTGFYAAFNDFRASDSQDGEAVALTLRALFDAFDLNGDGVVSENELVCGLSILCGGPKQEKVRAIFDLYDANRTYGGAVCVQWWDERDVCCACGRGVCFRQTMEQLIARRCRSTCRVYTPRCSSPTRHCASKQDAPQRS